MISITNFSKSYGTRILFENVSFSINRGEKIGLIGPNGAGKSTLFSLIVGDGEASSGSVQMHKNLRIGYLPQEANFHPSRTVLQEVLEGDPSISRLKKEKETLESEDKTHSLRYGEVFHELEHLGFFSLEHRAKQILAGLGFKERDFNRLITEMSGGWQMRVLLARLLTCEYDLLLLDEPTNYLDLNAALWFKDFLADYKNTFVMISHDKSFLNEVTTHTLILENGAIVKVRGGYAQYETIREEKRGYLLKQFKEQEKKKEQLQTFIDRFHGQPNKASQVRAKKTMLEKMEEIILPPDLHESIKTFRFPQCASSGIRPVALQQISKSYGDTHVYENLDFEIMKGEKAVLAGENGAGKSTLLKILAGAIDIDKGKRIVGHNVNIGYFSQTRMDVLNPDRTAFEEVASVAGGNVTSETMRTVLALFLFRGDDVEKKVKILSGGEKSRLILAKLLINPPNVLLLDEPTTHLDVDAVEALIKALTDYTGTIVFISHDIYFVRSVANNIFNVRDGRIRKFPGSFDDYLHRSSPGYAAFEETEAKMLLREKIKGETKTPVVREQEKTVLSGEAKKMHNENLAKRIKKLRKQEEKLRRDRYAKERVISNSRHGEEIIKYYTLLVEKIDQELFEIDTEINQLKLEFFPGNET